ncbi:hypothetical protein niasHT_032931 [Heterodera trifolii]|uniref:Uncharacterized protein n=1 Tax=Heterodera trifolii TaxID=157864 RepID=A0ABD2IXH4_9BILA
MSDNGNEAEAEMAKAIFISNDCWLSVFDLLPAYQLGLGIAMISHRFDFYVDEHFKTRKRTLKYIRIRRKIGENGTKEMTITNYEGKEMPIPQIPMPRKVIGFEYISILYIDHNVIAFLHHFRPLFASFPINLIFETNNDRRILEFILHNIWPMLGKNIYSMALSDSFFECLRQSVPSTLNDCPSLRFLFFNCSSCDLFVELPCDDSAAASDRQAVAKWLFTPLQNNVPKMFKCRLHWDDGNLTSKLEAFKAAFASASSPVNFIVSIWFMSSFDDSDVPFALTNELTREQLTLKRTSNSCRFLLIRSPISRDESKWTKWEEEAIRWQTYDLRNQIQFSIINEDEIGDGLLDATPGPSDQQQQK